MAIEINNTLFINFINIFLIETIFQLYFCKEYQLANDFLAVKDKLNI